MSNGVIPYGIIISLAIKIGLKIFDAKKHEIDKKIMINKSLYFFLKINKPPFYVFEFFLIFNLEPCRL